MGCRLDAGGLPAAQYMSTCSYMQTSIAAPVHRAPSKLSDDVVHALAETFRVLGDPTRVRILDAISTGELCVHDIAARAAISESAASHQLRLLRGMRLVRTRRAGRLIYYALDDHHIIELLRQALTHVQETPRREGAE